MLKNASRLGKIEISLAGLSGLLGIVTLFWHDWLEVTGWDPDHHNGTAEWFIAAALILLAVGLGMLARRETRRMPAHVGA